MGVAATLSELSECTFFICPVEKDWLESFIMSVPSLFLRNSFDSFLIITYQVFCY